MAFQKLHFNILPKTKMLNRSKSFLSRVRLRRSVRDFSDKAVPIDLITNAIKAAASAPSGANKQPWHFVIVNDSLIKKEIRLAAEKEEKAFYSYRASEEWLKDLEPFETSWSKPFLEIAPSLIVVFKKIYDVEEKQRKKNYYVNESVGIACGILLTALHNSGLATLTHTPAPMGFLEKILNRPKNEKAFLLIPVGFPNTNAEVPRLSKKAFNKVCDIL
ncbi:MAG: nitroreductase family protein [Candidatus Neomarinimicrobiota bacterium]